MPSQPAKHTRLGRDIPFCVEPPPSRQSLLVRETNSVQEIVSGFDYIMLASYLYTSMRAKG